MLARDCRVLPLDELLGTPIHDLPPRAVALTFDDGYLDNLEYAAPALERAGLPATFFLTTRWLEHPGEYWWDTLERVLLVGNTLPASIELPGPTPLHFETGTPEQRRAAHDALHALLVRATLDVRDRLVDAIARLGGPTARRRPIVADEVAQLARVPGASVAAHTVNHLSLAEQSRDVIDRELQECRETLERITGRAVQEFAYPYGAASRASADAVRGRFRWGLSCDERPIGASFDTARAGRVEVRNWTAAQLSETLDRVFAASVR
jgi:peptidoglycan/xylan/chitin deacetylase (PgdA/CDA1 family)